MRDTRRDPTLAKTAEPEPIPPSVRALASNLVVQLAGLSRAEQEAHLARQFYVEMKTREAREPAALKARTEDLRLPPGLGAVRARTIAASLVDALQPAVEAVRRDLFGSPEPPFAPSGSSGRARFKALGQAAVWIEETAAAQPTPAPGALAKTAPLLASAGAPARKAAALVGCEFEVRLVARHLDYVKPVAKKPVAKTASTIVARITGAGWLVRARVPVRAPAVEVTEAAIRPPAKAPPLWRLERACRAWAAETPFPVHDLVALVLGGVHPRLAPVRLTITHRPSFERGDPWRRNGEGGMAREITFVDGTGEVTVAQVVTQWRRARKKLGRYRRQRMTPEQADLHEVVRRVLAQAPEAIPSEFFSEMFWTRVVEEAGGRRTWRAAANQFYRAVGARTPRDALKALRALVPPRGTETGSRPSLSEPRRRPSTRRGRARRRTPPRPTAEGAQDLVRRGFVIHTDEGDIPVELTFDPTPRATPDRRAAREARERRAKSKTRNPVSG